MVDIVTLGSASNGKKILETQTPLIVEVIEIKKLRFEH